MRRAGIAALLVAGAGGATGCGSSGIPRSPEPPLAAAPVDAGMDAAPVAVAADAPDGAAVSGSREDRQIAKMMKHVSAARGLAALRAVPGEVLAREALLAKVRRHVETEVPPEAIRHEGLELQIFGFVPTSFDYLGATFDLLNAQLAGFYEPSDGTMYMAADLDGPNAEATLAHELDHALQDQHFDLKPHSKYESGKSDAQSAYDALSGGGDATSTMADVMFAKAMPGKTALDLPEGTFEGTILESINSGAAADAPHLMRSSLVAPYVIGTLFVNSLRRAGGWAAVDEAWKALPTTTEQILHVEKWRAHEPAIDVAPPSFVALGEGWSAADVDTTGELGLRLAFEEWMGADKAKVASRGWGGDRGALVESGDRTAMAIHVRHDAERCRAASEDPFPLVAAGPAGEREAGGEGRDVGVRRAGEARADRRHEAGARSRARGRPRQDRRDLGGGGRLRAREEVGRGDRGGSEAAFSLVRKLRGRGGGPRRPRERLDVQAFAAEDAVLPTSGSFGRSDARDRRFRRACPRCCRRRLGPRRR